MENPQFIADEIIGWLERATDPSDENSIMAFLSDVDFIDRLDSSNLGDNEWSDVAARLINNSQNSYHKTIYSQKLALCMSHMFMKSTGSETSNHKLVYDRLVEESRHSEAIEFIIMMYRREKLAQTITNISYYVDVSIEYGNEDIEEELINIKNIYRLDDYFMMKYYDNFNRIVKLDEFLQQNDISDDNYKSTIKIRMFLSHLLPRPSLMQETFNFDDYVEKRKQILELLGLEEQDVSLCPYDLDDTNDKILLELREQKFKVISLNHVPNGYLEKLGI